MSLERGWFGSEIIVGYEYTAHSLTVCTLLPNLTDHETNFTTMTYKLRVTSGSKLSECEWWMTGFLVQDPFQNDPKVH